MSGRHLQWERKRKVWYLGRMEELSWWRNYKAVLVKQHALMRNNIWAIVFSPSRLRMQTAMSKSLKRVDVNLYFLGRDPKHCRGLPFISTNTSSVPEISICDVNHFTIRKMRHVAHM